MRMLNRSVDIPHKIFLFGFPSQIESAVEAIGDGAEVTRGIFGEIEGMIGAAQAGFDVGNHGVHPFEFRNLFWLASTDDDGVAPTARRRDGTEAGQAVRKYLCPWNSGSFGPIWRWRSG